MVGMESGTHRDIVLGVAKWPGPLMQARDRFLIVVFCGAIGRSTVEKVSISARGFSLNAADEKLRMMRCLRAVLVEFDPLIYINNRSVVIKKKLRQHHIHCT